MNSSRSFDPEVAFLLAATGPAETPLRPDTVHDWDRVARLAMSHRIYPRVWRRAHALFPEAAASVLHNAARRNAEAALRNVKRTIDVVDHLRGQGIEPIVLKGPLLAFTLYGDYAARVSGDIDLLVREHELLPACEILAAAGFAHHTPLSKESLQQHRRSQHDVAFEHPDDSSLIELHADIAQPLYGYRIELDDWYRQSRPMRVGTSSLAVLSVDHAFVLAGLHAAKHRWHRLDLIADLAAFQRMGFSRAHMAASAAPAWQITTMQLGDDLATWFFGEGSPENGRLRGIAAQIVQGKQLGKLEGLRFDLRLRPQPRERARYIWQRLLSAKLARS